ncbi:MAG: DbpA RNA binding domain-containing protein, partial [Acidobacteriota bacterium]
PIGLGVVFEIAEPESPVFPQHRRATVDHIVNQNSVLAPAVPEGQTKLFINRGKQSGITEDDLRWALQEGAVLPEDAVSEIRILDRFSFVEIDSDRAEKTVEFLDGTKLKGSEIRVEVARS